MDHDSFMAYGERCRKVWCEFQDSFHDSRLKTYLKHAHAVLSCASGQIPLDGLDACSIAMSSLGSFISSRASKNLIEHVRLLESLKKETEATAKTERGRVEKWLRKFNRRKLEFEEHRLEIRFASLKMDLIQEIKRSPFVDSDLTGMGPASIRIVLRIPIAP